MFSLALSSSVRAAFESAESSNNGFKASSTTFNFSKKKRKKKSSFFSPLFYLQSFVYFS